MTGLWETLLSAALVGTDRRPAAVGTPPAPLRTVVRPELVAAGPGGLLDAAAAVTVARRAGRLPASVSVGEGAPDEIRPLPPDPAVGRLTHLLLGLASSDHDAERRTTLLIEWLTLAAQRGLRVPGRFLPDLLDMARRRAELRPLIGAVGGERVRWLADLRSDWAWVRQAAPAEVMAETQWHEGTSAERTAYLTWLRSRDPDAARELLAQAWPQERPEDRAAFLGTFTAGLGPRDEEFCEAALDDRRKEVRTVAAELLAILPGSAYQRRMADRALACVRVVAGHLLVTPPAECDKAMRRDGVDERPPRGTGERAWWFEQIVARTHLSTWRGGPADLLARPVDDDWRPVLHRAWAQAAVAQQDRAWAVALIRADFGRGRGAAVHDSLLALSLYEILPPDEAVRLVVDAVAGPGEHIEHLLPRCPRPWPEPLVRGVLARLREPGARPGTRPSDLAGPAALGLPPEAAGEVAAIADARRAGHPDDHQQRHLDRLAATLTTRLEMHREFS